MNIDYATTPGNHRAAWPLELDGSATRGVIVGGTGAGKTQTLRTLAAQAEAAGVRVWSCSRETDGLAGQSMDYPQWCQAIRSYRGRDMVLAVMDMDITCEVSALPGNNRVCLILATPARTWDLHPRTSEDAPRLIGEDVRLDLGAGRAYGGPGRGLMQGAGEGTRQVRVDYLPPAPVRGR